MQIHYSGFWDDRKVPEKLVYEAASWSSTNILDCCLRVTIDNGRKRNKGTRKKKNLENSSLLF
jgi:hypothetical protein